MERKTKRRLAIGAAGLAVLAGGGAAYGVTQNGGNERQAFLNDAAKRLNVTPQQLQNALKGAFSDRLDAAVKAGRLTQAQADAIKQRMAQNGGLPRFGAHRMFMHGPRHDGIDAAAKYLGLTDVQLFDKLRSGKSLADVAGDEGKSVDGLKTAMRDAIKADLDTAVKNGPMTQAQENNILSRIDSRLNDLVNHKGLGPGPGGPLGPPKGGMRFGGAPAGGPPPDMPMM